VFVAFVPSEPGSMLTRMLFTATRCFALCGGVLLEEAEAGEVNHVDEAG